MKCKFGDDCERNNCMFKHTVPKKKNDAEGSICENENVEAKIEDIDSDSENDIEDDNISENEKTFLILMQSKKRKM